eukprot:jgi/Chrzof1/8360/Cz03g07160.t1
MQYVCVCQLHLSNLPSLPACLASKLRNTGLYESVLLLGGAAVLVNQWATSVQLQDFMQKVDKRVLELEQNVDKRVLELEQNVDKRLLGLEQTVDKHHKDLRAQLYEYERNVSQQLAEILSALGPTKDGR